MKLLIVLVLLGFLSISFSQAAEGAGGSVSGSGSSSSSAVGGSSFAAFLEYILYLPLLLLSLVDPIAIKLGLL